MNELKLIILLSFFLTAGVCEMVPNSETIRVDDLYGSYKANFPSGLEDNIEIFMDSNLYIRTFRSFDNNLYIDSGKWDILIHDSNTVDLLLRSFKLRFTIDSLLKPDTEYSNKNATVDSSKITLYLPIWKYDNGNRIILGAIFGQAWDKLKSKK